MSDPSATGDLAWLGRALERLTTEVASLRDDLGVLTAITIRLDGTLTALLAENRAMHSHHARLANRVRALEEAP
jgi:hypothetical protein